MPTLFDLYGIDLGQPDEPPPPKSGLIRRAVGDTAVTAVKSAIGLPEFAVGLANLATGGGAGKALENEGGAIGFRPKQAREFLDTLYSPQQQEANRKVQEADGFFATAEAALRNPSTIAHAVLESAPSMLGAAGAARGLMAVAPKVNPLIAVGAGEGIFSAGSAAEQIRQQTDDGRLTGEQSLIAGTSGALNGVISAVTGKIANKLGIGDVQQMLAGVQQAGPKAEKALTRALLEGFATEGILQELPQSAQEQIAQNVALGRPWDEGVGNAAAMGTLAGGVMGVGGAAIGRMRREPEQPPPPAPVDPIAESNAKASEAMNRLATVGTVAEMAKAAADVVDSSTLGPLGISAEQEARVMQAGEELAKADLTDMKNMGRLDRTRSPEPPAPIVPASAEGPAPFLDRLLTATEALQDPAVRQRVEQAAGPQYLAQLDQYAEVANTPGVMDGVGDQVRERFLGLMERAVFPDRFRQPAPPVQRAERRKSDPVPIEPFRVEPFATDPVLDYVDAKRAENTMAARAFVKEFEAGRITRRDVVRVMQDRNADPLGSNPDPLASIQPATPAPNLVQQRLEAAARAGQAQPTGIQIEPSRARPKGQSDERNPERAVPGEGRPVDTGNQPGTSGVVSGELQQPGAPGPAGAPVPSAVQGVDAERAGRGLGDDALSSAQAQAGTPAEGAGGSRPSPAPALSIALTKEYESRASAPDYDATTPLDSALSSATNPLEKDVDRLVDSMEWAQSNGRPDIASAIYNKLTHLADKFRSEGENYNTTPAVPADSPKFEKIQKGLQDRKAKLLADAEKARAAAQAASRKDVAARATSSAQAQAGTPAKGAGGSRPTTGQAKQADEIGERIGAALEAGIELTQLDQAAIREAAGKAKELRDRANRISGRGADPMNKGNAFPMGVGFTKMTKRSEQRLDASVRRAGEAVELWKQAEQFEKQVESYLQGKGTEADKAKRAARKTETQRELVNRLVGWKKGDKIGAYTIERVNKDRDGYPASYTISGDGVIKGVMDRVDVAREFFGGDKAKLRAMVDEARTAAAAQSDQDTAANEAATSPANDLPEPTEAQKEAGNYKVGRIKVAGLDISVENPAGSERSGIDPDGKKWRNTLAHHYGYIRRSEGADGDHVDVFVNPGTPEDYDGQVFVVDQADPKTGRFDEHKVMMGFPSAKAAQEAYQANYAKDWTGLRAVQPMTMEQFKAWVSDPANTKKPAAKGVKPGKGEKVERPDELVELRKRESALKSLRECLG